MMICESNHFDDYVQESNEVDYAHPLIKETAMRMFASCHTEVEKVKKAFVFVRDEITHSWDIQSERITCRASEVLKYKEGICYAKSNLFAALLRSQGIPTGFCYQRLMLFDTPESGHCIHALNAVFISSLQKWIRLDARGNKEGIDAQFSLREEKLAFPIRKEYGEKDYPFIYVKPNPKTVHVLETHTNAIEMYTNHLPDCL